MSHQFYPQVSHPYRFELNKDMDFSAAHWIDAEGAGKCNMMHGHNYSVNITVCGDKLDEAGFLVNFQTLKALVNDRFDHSVLNESAETNKPTTEAMAKIISDLIQTHLSSRPNGAECMQVVLRETPTSYVVYRKNGGFQ